MQAAALKRPYQPPGATADGDHRGGSCPGRGEGEQEASEGAGAMRIATSEEAGRFYVAARAICAGERLLSVAPDAAVVQERNVPSLCAHCFEAVSKKVAITCERCRYAVYCSAACQAAGAAAHGLECAALARLRAAPPQLNTGSTTHTRLVMQILYQRHASQGRHPLEGLHTGLEAFQALEVWPDQVGRYRVIAAACATLCSDLEVRDQEVIALLAAIDCNAFLLWNGNRRRKLGLALYGTASLFNHSCDPSVARVQRRGAAAEFYALREVPEGAPLCIAYCDPRKDRAERLAELRVSYGFACSCPRCGHCVGPSNGSDREPLDDAMFCPRHLGYLIPRGGRHWCSVCCPPPRAAELLPPEDPAWELFG